MNTGKLKLARLMQQFEVHNRSDGKAEKTVLWYNQALEPVDDLWNMLS